MPIENKFQRFKTHALNKGIKIKEWRKLFSQNLFIHIFLINCFHDQNLNIIQGILYFMNISLLYTV